MERREFLRFAFGVAAGAGRHRRRCCFGCKCRLRCWPTLNDLDAPPKEPEAAAEACGRR